MKLWHDDCRVPPDDSWVWARTNEDAKRHLLTNKVAECSLDHDLGLHDLEVPEDEEERLQMTLLRGASSVTGLELVHWMVETGHVPPVVRIHSWNPDGAAAMAARFNRYGYDCIVEPFVPYHLRGGVE